MSSDRRLSALRLAGRVSVGATGLAIVLATLWLLAFATAAPLSLGWTPVLIVSNSMTPAISEGDIILIDDDVEAVGIGSVVTFAAEDDERLITHRVVGVDEDGRFLTRGDANRTNDSTSVAPDEILGQAKVLVPMAGLPWLWISHGRWFALAAALGVLAVSVVVARWALENSLSRDGVLDLDDPGDLHEPGDLDAAGDLVGPGDLHEPGDLVGPGAPVDSEMQIDLSRRSDTSHSVRSPVL